MVDAAILLFLLHSISALDVPDEDECGVGRPKSWIGS
jgi:hypothetical protein